jgi:hypothetical protein
MRVYVESNFLLEIVRQQEQSDSASELLEFARQGRLELAVPAFSLTEPYWTLGKDSAKREDYLKELQQEINQLQRSRDRIPVAEIADTLIEQLRTLESDETRALDHLVFEMCRVGKVVNLSATVISSGWQLTVSDDENARLTMQDAFVLGSIVDDLLARPAPEHCAFISRDRKAFGNPAIVLMLQAFACKYLPTFTDAVAFVKSRLPR